MNARAAAKPPSHEWAVIVLASVCQIPPDGKCNAGGRRNLALAARTIWTMPATWHCEVECCGKVEFNGTTALYSTSQCRGYLSPRRGLNIGFSDFRRICQVINQLSSVCLFK